MTSLSIRPFTLAEYVAVRAIWESSEGIGLSAADSLEGIRKFLERNPGMSFVAAVGNKIVGAILIGHDGRRGLIHHLAVAPEHRNQGIGRALAERGLHALQEAGIEKAHLLVFTSNGEARAFWRRIGATERVEIALFSMGSTAP
jgi:ribosomal protein S18 acetylase RimI-like enzyme